MYIVIPDMKTDEDSDSLDEILSATDVDAISDSKINESMKDGTMSDVVYVLFLPLLTNTHKYRVTCIDLVV